MNINILHRPTALENLLAGRIWPAGRRLPMHAIEQRFADISYYSYFISYYKFSV